MPGRESNRPPNASREPEPDGSAVFVLYAFSAFYPVLHYLLSNPDVFTVALGAQFTLAACVIPGVTWLVLRVVLRQLASGRVSYLINLVAAIAILALYLRPFLRQLPIWVLKTSGLYFGPVLIWIPVFAAFFWLGYRFRSSLSLFLSIVLALTAANTGYALYTSADSPGRQAGRVGSGEELGTPFEVKPSIYFLVVDAYLNRPGLVAKGLEHLDVGPELSERGFRVYENAFCNYKPSIRSMTSFFDLQHHYYQQNQGWEDQITGDSTLYGLLRSNGYTTAVAHPNDYLLRGHCKSDVCYPAPDALGRLGFMLAETLFYRADFTRRTSVGLEQYQEDLYQLLEQTPSPTVLYSHVGLPNHGPNGCTDPEAALQGYGDRLELANSWIQRTADKIESFDDKAIIVFMGDHGAFLTDHCNRRNPDASSQAAVIDHMGVLLAVKWPEGYDGRYDAGIHSLMDFSWYLMQFLGGDAMDETRKPRSASYLLNNEERLIYEVVRDGELVPSPVGVEKLPYRARGGLDFDHPPAP